MRIKFIIRRVKMDFIKNHIQIIIVGLIIGIGAALLDFFGNPPNMGICIACMERDIAGALGLHSAGVVQYLRPEIFGFLLGAFIIALLKREYKPRGGSSPIIRFFLGVFAMIGALVFLGCPWRALLRLAGGDLNTLVGIPGLIFGIAIGVWFLKNGFSLGRAQTNTGSNGWIMPVFMMILLGLFIGEVLFPAEVPITFSQSGPGAMHPEKYFVGDQIVAEGAVNYGLFIALGISLGFALIFGGMAQRTRFCTMGSLRDIILIRDFHLVYGVIALVVGAFIVNLIAGNFNPGYYAQPIAHSNAAFNFFGMMLSGLAYSLAGGCPGRQLVMAGEGDSDAGVFVMGMIVGAGVAHNLKLAAIPDKMQENQLIIGGPAGSTAAIIALIIGIGFCLIIGWTMREKSLISIKNKPKQVGEKSS